MASDCYANNEYAEISVETLMISHNSLETLNINNVIFNAEDLVIGDFTTEEDATSLYMFKSDADLTINFQKAEITNFYGYYLDTVFYSAGTLTV